MPRTVHDGIRKRCACGPRKWSKCQHPWHFSFHHGGHEHRYSLEVVARARGEQPPVGKTEAVAWRDRLRGEIRSGVLGRVDVVTVATTPAVVPALTFGNVCDQYLDRHVRKPTRGARAQREMEILIAVMRRAEIPTADGGTIRLEAKPISAITRADVESVRVWRRREQAARVSIAGCKGGEVGTNRLLSRLRHVFSWAIDEQHVAETPFKRGARAVVHLEVSQEAARARRLVPSVLLPDGTVREGEEARLLKHAGPHMRALVVAALLTGCRLGELLSLQWSQIERDERGLARRIFLPAGKTKSARNRWVPIAPNLQAVLELRRHAPDGTEHGPNAYVFGNDVGEPVADIRAAWKATCTRAEIAGLHFHDLRREFASRLLESRVGLHDIKTILGHANITTTSVYLQSSLEGIERAMTHARLEASIVAEPAAAQVLDVPGEKVEVIRILMS